MTDEQRAAYIRALLVERAHYERFGVVDRVVAVDAELTRLGHGVVPARRAQTRKR